MSLIPCQGGAYHFFLRTRSCREKRTKLDKKIYNRSRCLQVLQAAEHRIGRLEQAMHELDANLEQENQDKQIAQRQVAKSKEVSGAAANGEPDRG